SRSTCACDSYPAAITSSPSPKRRPRTSPPSRRCTKHAGQHAPAGQFLQVSHVHRSRKVHNGPYVRVCAAGTWTCFADHLLSQLPRRGAGLCVWLATVVTRSCGQAKLPEDTLAGGNKLCTNLLANPPIGSLSTLSHFLFLSFSLS